MTKRKQKTNKPRAKSGLYLTIGTKFPGTATLLFSGTNVKALKDDLDDNDFPEYDFVTVVGPLPVVKELDMTKPVSKRELIAALR